MFLLEIISTFSYFQGWKIPTFSYFWLKIPTFSYFFDLSYRLTPCYQKLEICKFREQIGSRLALIGSETSHDRERIPSHSCDLSEPIRGSESQKVDPLPIHSQSAP